MEESGELQLEENKGLPDKNKRRRFKTPSQLQALEDFYNEHKYPTESMKADLAEKLGLTEKQISGWFCHRRLKDKRISRGEACLPGRQDLSSGVIQDRGSGLRQDSCSSTKQGDYRLADVREVESRRFSHDGVPSADLNYEQRRLYDGTQMDDTSSESSSALQESFFPQNRSPLGVETPEYQPPNGLIAKSRGRVGPSGYLKIKGQTENAAITAVKRQLGRHYREDGPPLGIEFDPLPPAAFESPSKTVSNDAYGVPEPIVSSSLDVSGIRKRPGLSSIRNQDMFVEATDYRQLHKADQDFSYRQPKQKPSFSNQSRVFPGQKSSFNVDSYSAREPSDYDSGINHSIQRKRDPHPYGSKIGSESEEPWSPSYADVNNPKLIRKRERLDSRVSAPLARHKDPVNMEDRVPSSRMVKDGEPYGERRPKSENHDSIRLKMRPTNELRAGKREREDFLQDDYGNRTLSQEPPQWSRQIKGSTAEMPSSFSEDETAETSSSVD